MQFGWKHNVIHGSFLFLSPSSLCVVTAARSTRTQNFISYRKMCVSSPIHHSFITATHELSDEARCLSQTTLGEHTICFHWYGCCLPLLWMFVTWWKVLNLSWKLLVINQMLMDCSEWWISFYAVENWDIHIQKRDEFVCLMKIDNVGTTTAQREGQQF